METEVPKLSKTAGLAVKERVGRPLQKLSEQPSNARTLKVAGLEQSKPPMEVRDVAPLGARIKEARVKNGWTLSDASDRCGVARSTLSKIENNLMSPTYDLLYKIAVGLKLDLVQLFDARPRGDSIGRRSVTRKRHGKIHETPYYTHELIATDLAHKKMLPFKTRVKARSINDFQEWIRHEGEEFFVVLSGSVEVHTDLYTPVILEAGDSIYFDSKMGHAVVSVSQQDAEIMWVCTGLPEP